MTTYYKVVNLGRGGEFWSAFAGLSSRVEYVVGEWARPKEGCGPLCVFDSMASAQHFTNEGSQALGIEINYARLLLVFECEIEPSSHTIVYRKVKRGRDVSTLPRGTVLADAVKLVKRATTPLALS